MKKDFFIHLFTFDSTSEIPNLTLFDDSETFIELSLGEKSTSDLALMFDELLVDLLKLQGRKIRRFRRVPEIIEK